MARDTARETGGAAPKSLSSSNRRFSAVRMAPLLAAVSAPALLAQAAAAAGAPAARRASRVAAQKQHLARSRRTSAATASAVGPGPHREPTLATEASDRRAPALVAALAAAVLVSIQRPSRLCDSALASARPPHARARPPGLAAVRCRLCARGGRRRRHSAAAGRWQRADAGAEGPSRAGAAAQGQRNSARGAPRCRDGGCARGA